MTVSRRRFLLATAILAIALAIGAVVFSGDRKTMASRSAAALREALQKGEPVGGSTHDGHDGAPMTKDEMPDHGTSPSGESGSDDAMPGMAGMQHGTTGAQPGMAGMAGMQHGTTGVQPGMAGMVGMQHGTTGVQPGMAGMAGMQHGTAGAQPGMAGMAGMQHGTTGAQPGMAGMAGMQHGTANTPSMGRPTASTSAGAVSASPGQPASTLAPDPLDRPAETSVVDATRSLEMNREMGGMEGMQHGMTSYRQLDAGRDTATSMPAGESGSPPPSVAPRAPAAAPDHRGMQHGSPQPAPTPVPRPAEPPSQKKPGAPPVAPTRPPHHHSGGSGSGSLGSGAPR